MEQRQALLSIRLNEAQRQAVQTIDGPVLVIAGAGTGKTATLTARVAHMIEQGIDPKSILLLTFTRKAAAELRARFQIDLEKEARSAKGEKGRRLRAAVDQRQAQDRAR